MSDHSDFVLQLVTIVGTTIDPAAVDLPPTQSIDIATDAVPTQ
ncbi:hypothetical protein B0I08_10796 [Glaciihabitans tibetensis]|uniref:Uncharacterized protein n=1 Tax=Glaciihabitans tibetensis TaxID=1266600 RepID=A0A2T0VAL9_9MICO|nr:hypothetical protein [Glaciihabitans tibetensis]PRY67201.1 hypothetical protein B0I08_10796 [Glaciihabitans tibetensis]